MRDDPRDRRLQELATGLRAALDGSLLKWTTGQLRALEAVVAASSVDDLAAVVERLIGDALETVLVRRLRPCTRPPPEPVDTADERIRRRRRTRQDEL